MHEPPTELDGFQVVPGGTLAPRGFVGGGLAAGIKATGALDLGAILSTRTPCQSAATFTTNRVCGASVTINKERLGTKPARGIVFNSGNSNVFTGARGRADGLAFIDAFAGLGMEGAATIRAVAPGISEALIATAAGLFAAIPAVIAYNYFVHHLKEFASAMDDFSLEFLNLMERTFL